jgi:hypothetical protein
MSETSFDGLAKLCRRSLAILDEEEERRPRPNLRAIAPRVRRLIEEFLAVQESVRSTETAACRAADRARLRLDFFGKVHDAVRLAVAANLPLQEVGLEARRHATEDDLIRAAEALRRVIERHAREEWARKILPAYAEDLQTAAREWGEGAESLRRLERLMESRREAAERLLGVLLEFRRGVKAAYGYHSREYQAIRADSRGDELGLGEAMSAVTPGGPKGEQAA